MLARRRTLQPPYRPLRQFAARRRALLLALVGLAVAPQPLCAEQATIAVAANFRLPLQALAERFEANTGHRLTIVSGSTGQLTAQVVNGAPFDVLLAADQVRPQRLAADGIGDPASVFTYASGRLAIWSPMPGKVSPETLDALPDAGFRWLAIADPALAPYGAAARQALERLGAWQSLQPRIVTGQNVAQAFAMVRTGNAQLGIVALSLALSYDGPASYVVLPAELYEPVRQDAIRLHRADDNAAAAAFLEFLASDEAARLIERHGYAVETAGRAPRPEPDTEIR